MPAESQIHMASRDAPKRFATGLALFYGAQFIVLGHVIDPEELEV